MTQSLRQEEQSSETSFARSLQQAREQSKATWARDLQGIYEHAKERFADITWVADAHPNSVSSEDAEVLKDDHGAVAATAVDAILSPEQERHLDDVDAIFGHKAIIYARAPKAFKDRYFPVSATGMPSNQNHGPAPLPAHRAATSASTPNLHCRTTGTEATRSTSSFALLPTAKPLAEHDEVKGSSQITYGPGVSVLSHHGMPEMLKQALEWLYTAKVPSEQDAPALEFMTTGCGEDPMDRIAEDDGGTQNLGLISAKGANGVDMVKAKVFRMCQLRLAQVSVLLSYFLSVH